MKKFHIHTFGCQMNVHDSEKMAGVLKNKGYEVAEGHKDADIIIFNTCNIRQKAEQKFLSELGRLKKIKKQRPGLKIAVAGCIAQQTGMKLFKRAPHVDYVLGPQNIHMLGNMINSVSAVALEDNPDIATNELPSMRTEKGRAWVTIMYGCNNFCSYCVVPYARGRERSRPSGSISREISELVDEGCMEATLLGQNVNSYRSDTDFSGLLKKLCKFKELKRIRFVTSHPKDLSDDLIRSIAEIESVCEHIHLPLQSGSDRILGLMNRKYSMEQYMGKVDKLREAVPGIAITTDIIAGFPTETEEDHRDTVRALENIRFDGIYAFKYSRRPDTKASDMDGQLKEELKLERLQELLEIQDNITLLKNRQLEGSIQEVLVEGKSVTDSSKFTGRTRTNKIVNFPSNKKLSGSIQSILIRRARRHSLDGEITPDR